MNKLARLFHKSLRLDKNDDGYKVISLMLYGSFLLLFISFTIALITINAKVVLSMYAIYLPIKLFSTLICLFYLYNVRKNETRLKELMHTRNSDVILTYLIFSDFVILHIIISNFFELLYYIGKSFKLNMLNPFYYGSKLFDFTSVKLSKFLTYEEPKQIEIEIEKKVYR